MKLQTTYTVQNILQLTAEGSVKCNIIQPWKCHSSIQSIKSPFLLIFKESLQLLENHKSHNMDSKILSRWNSSREHYVSNVKSKSTQCFTHSGYKLLDQLCRQCHHHHVEKKICIAFVQDSRNQPVTENTKFLGYNLKKAGNKLKFDACEWMFCHGKVHTDTVSLCSSSDMKDDDVGLAILAMQGMMIMLILAFVWSSRYLGSYWKQL